MAPVVVQQLLPGSSPNSPLCPGTANPSPSRSLPPPPSPFYPPTQLSTKLVDADQWKDSLRLTYDFMNRNGALWGLGGWVGIGGSF